MAIKKIPGADAVKKFGWLRAHKYLLLRRISQLSILLLFLLGPWFGIWLIKGNMASSLTLDVLPLTDPMVAAQVLLAGQDLAQSAIIGALIVLVFYWLVGGRVYCSWVCPINMVSDLAAWLRAKLAIKGGASWSRDFRYWLLAAVALVALVSGTVAYELINPVSMVFRGIVFGLGMGWGVIMAIFLLDLLVARDGWCGHLCPVGAFYSLIGKYSILRVSAANREQCDDCMDCFAICPESKIIKAPLKGANKGFSPVILSGNCTNCGRCIDVCAKEVFHFSTRFNHSGSSTAGHINQREVSS